MSTNWFHDLFFGSNESSIEALEKLQQMDAEQFQKAFSAIKELQNGQQINVDQLQTAFGRLEKLEKGQLFNAEQIQVMQEHLNGLQERLADVEGKVETLTETVADQEKVMLTCCIVASVIAIAAISFIGFCIYQGIKSEKEKQKNSSQSAPTGDLIDFGPTMPDTKLEVGDNTQELPKGPGLRAVD